MSQYGMQMPGGHIQRGATMNIYTGLLALAVAALIGATTFVYFQAAKLGKDGQPFSIQSGEITMTDKK